MKAMILAAGKGTRMRPLTLSCPKPMLKLAGKPLIVHHIERLVQAGITDIVINHAWLGEQIVNGIGDGSRWGAQIQYSSESEPLETAGGIAKALPLLGGSPFLVVNGDLFCDYPIPPASLASGDLAHLVLVPNPEHNLKGDFALSRGRVQSDGEPRYTFSGISLLSPQLFAGVGSEHAKLAPLLRQAMASGRVSGELYKGLWRDVGTPAQLSQLEQQLADPSSIQE